MSRYNVVRSTPASRAAFDMLPPARVVRRDRYSCSKCAIRVSLAVWNASFMSAVGRPASATGASSYVGMSAGSIGRPASAITAICSITFCSSRTLPRHGLVCRNVMVSAVSAGGGPLARWRSHERFRKNSASNGMSSSRLRSGGSLMGTTRKR